MPTVLPASMPQCSAMFSTKLVFPIDGRAATMTRSDFWKPDVISSRSTKPLGTPVTRPLCCLELLDQLVAGVDELAQLDEAGPHPVLGDLEDRPLGLVEQVVGVLLGVVGARQHLVRRLDQPAQRGLLLDDLRVVLDVGRARHAVGERRRCRRARRPRRARPTRVSSSLSVTRSTGSLRSVSPTIFSKMRRCASRKKSLASMTSAAWLNAWLLMRIAPSTHFSASRLCGRVRSMADETIPSQRRSQKFELPAARARDFESGCVYSAGDDLHLDVAPSRRGGA